MDSEAKIDPPIDADYTRTDLDRLDVHCGWSQASDFFLHAISDSRIHSGAIRQHCVGVKSSWVSRSHFMMELCVVSYIPAESRGPRDARFGR